MARSRNSSNNKPDTTAVVKEAPQRKTQTGSKVKTSTQKEPPTNSNRSKGKKNTPNTATASAGGGRGGSKGKGNKKGANANKKQAPKKPLTAEQLDKQMDDYMMRNEKTAEKVLEDQMDDYWAQKGKKDTTDEAVPDEGEVDE